MAYYGGRDDNYGSPSWTADNYKGSTRKSNKTKTCWYWKNNRGGCKYTSQNCPFAHHDTGVYAPPPFMTSKKTSNGENPTPYQRREQTREDVPVPRATSNMSPPPNPAPLIKDPRLLKLQKAKEQKGANSPTNGASTDPMDLDRASVPRSDSTTSATNIAPSPTPPKPPNKTTPQADPEANALSAVLGEFASHISALAATHLELNIASRRRANKLSLYNKSQRHHAAYPAIAEQAEKAKLDAETQYEAVNQKLRQFVALSDKLTEHVVEKVKSASIKGREDHEQKQIFHLQQDIKVLRNQVNANAGSSEDFKRLFKQDEDFEKRLSLQQTRTKVNTDGLNAIQNELTSKFSKLEIDTKENTAEIKVLKHNVAERSQGIDDLKTIIEGETGQSGLVNIASELETTIAKHRSVLETHDAEISSLDTGVSQLKVQLENAQKDIQTKLVTAHSEPPAVGKDNAISQVLEDLVVLRREQETKDDLVAEEVESLKKSISELTSMCSSFRQHSDDLLDRFVKQTKEKYDQLKDIQKADSSSIKSPIGQNQLFVDANLQQDLKGLREAHSTQQKSNETLKVHIDALHLSVQSLDTRMNSLSTDHVVKSMLNQMSQVYPFITNIPKEVQKLQSGFDEMLKQMKDLDKFYQELSREQQKLSGKLVANDTESSSRFTELEKNTTATMTELANKHHELVERYETNSKSIAETVAEIFVKIENSQRYTSNGQVDVAHGHEMRSQGSPTPDDSWRAASSAARGLGSRQNGIDVSNRSVRKRKRVDYKGDDADGSIFVSDEGEGDTDDEDPIIPRRRRAVVSPTL